MEHIQIITSKEEIQAIITDALSKAIVHMSATPTSQAGVEIIDTKELARRLNISPVTIRSWRNKGKISAIRINSAVRYNWYQVMEQIQPTLTVR
ncbi:helix-turn-helix domain-containing protein [Olivibacter sp. CPCC 100613]|uniref:helix-turn-helix domain-containing protein n=1 Tax=Olivibacter sp. CPCC 100613 TaxID=3079931 RepID=UPI002FF71FFE